MSLVLTEDLARRIERAEIEALESRLTAIKKIDGNPMGVEVKKFGNATAYSVKNIPGPSFNTVKGISGNDVEHVDHMIDFYNQRDIQPRFEITPAYSSSELFKALSDKGYTQCGFHTSLYGELTDETILNPKLNSLITIREIKQHEYDVFGDIYVKGFNMPSFLKEHVAKNNKVLHNNEHWTIYLATIEDKPVGIGVLFAYDGIGSLAASVTHPEFRNKGVHRALVFKRLQQAIGHNCHLVVGQAEYGSVSQNNMEKTGMKIAYTKSIWTKP